MKSRNKRKGMSPKTAKIASTISLIALIGSCIAVNSTVSFDNPEPIEAKAEPAHTAYVEEVKTATLTSYEVPDGKTSFKSYMDYRCITNKRSEQYKLQQDCWTDADGLRRYDDDYVVALGTFYADEIGDRYKITLANDTTFYAVVGDFKANKHTDKTNRYTPTQDVGKCVIEFIVDTKKLDKSAKRMGDISYCGSKFKGNIKKIEKEE